MSFGDYLFITFLAGIRGGLFLAWAMVRLTNVSDIPAKKKKKSENAWIPSSPEEIYRKESARQAADKGEKASYSITSYGGEKLPLTPEGVFEISPQRLRGSGGILPLFYGQGEERCSVFWAIRPYYRLKSGSAFVAAEFLEKKILGRSGAGDAKEH